MSQGWTNLRQRESQLRSLEKHYRETGYSDGYGLQLARSLNVVYQQGWKLGREARRRFDNGGAT